MIRLIPIFISLFSAFTIHAQQQSYSLTVNVVDAEPGVGQIIATLFNSEQTYLKMPAAQQIVAVDQNGNSVLQFDHLFNGEYAVSVIYDQDVDGELDTGLFGIPKEKIGFSNNAKARFGPASFDDTKFRISNKNSIVTIHLKNAKN